jgi:hypothetical protein
MAHIVASYYAADKLLKPLGVDTKRLIRCHIFFEPDDMVRVNCEYALEDPSKEAVGRWKRYALAELIPTPQDEFDDLMEVYDETIGTQEQTD